MSYQVKLGVFEGPLDLLLHLIRKNELDIYDIPIAMITQQYMEYLALMKTLNLDIAGEFLVMAATLMYIKSRTLLPSTADEEDGEEDPRQQLIRQLLEYQRFKDVAQQLREYEEKREELFTRQPLPPEDISPEEDGLEVSLFELLRCFKKVMERTERVDYYEISAGDDISIEQQAKLILDKISTHPRLSFEELFAGGQTKLQMIVTFLALLELARHQQVVVRQPVPFGQILIYAVDKGNS
jgi:segregation and condensation protein A